MSENFEFRLPDLGDFDSVEVVEVLVRAGDSVEAEQSLIVLESDKATMEIPSPVSGVIAELCVKVGDAVGENALIAVLRGVEDEAGRAAGAAAGKQRAGSKAGAGKAEKAATADEASAAPSPQAGRASDAAPATAAASAAPLARAATALPATGSVHASPSVRHLASEFGIDLRLVVGSGRKGRITREDVRRYVKQSLAGATPAGVGGAGFATAPLVSIDFSRFGEIETRPLSRIRKLTASNLHRSWVTAPHVTQFDEADITELETFRKAQKAEAAERGVKLTFLPFIVKAVVSALREFPDFNASLDPSGESLILKRYFHIGVAVDTENGLLVPVLRDADQKGVLDLASELEALSARARERRLRPADLQGGSFSISSLGGIGGTFFTPIVNHPEVAILGVSRMQWKPVLEGETFTPRLMLPLSLSYDHRVIDGAAAVRFTRHLSGLLSDMRLALL